MMCVVGFGLYRKDLDVRWRARDCTVLAGRTCVPEVDAIHVPGRHHANREPQQRSPGRGVAGRVE